MLACDEVAPEVGDTVAGTIMYLGEVGRPSDRVWARGLLCAVAGRRFR